MSATVLVVDDEPRMRRVLELMLEGFGHRVLGAGDVESAMALLAREQVDLVFTDLQLPGLSGLELLRRARERQPELPIVMITAFATVETAVRAIKLGAYDYLVKPFRIEEIEALVTHALTLRDARRENAYLRELAAEPYEGIVGSSAVMQRLFAQVERVAPSPTTVLVTGETGTGKELVAHAIHRRSPRAERLFVAVNCAAIPADLLEAELFGVVRGAYTGAVKDRAGKFELADGGTLFLDEIGDMPLAMQAKLLRVLQEGTVERLGGGAPRTVDVRIIAATHRDLQLLARDGAFRSDLYYRLAVFPIALPPLRERRGDIPALARHAVERFARRAGRDIALADAAIARLSAYDWPGNVRELHNVLERAVLLATGDQLEADAFDDLPTVVPPPAPEPGALPTLEQAVAIAEREAILAALAATADNKTRAAELLGISVRTLWYKLQRLGITGPASATHA